MSSLDKKSSIPRPAQGHDCQGKPRPKAPKAPFTTQKPPQHSKPPVDDGLRPEHADALRCSLQKLEADHEQMKKVLEDTVKEAEERLETMRKLMEEKERLMAGDLETQAQKIEELEQTVNECEKKLVENNIDPVTMEKRESNEEEAEAVEKVRRVTKADVDRMRDKLHAMSEKSDKCLSDVQNMMQELKELEETSSRAGGISVDEPPSFDVAAFIAEQEKKEKEEKARKKRASEKDADDSESPSSSPEPEAAAGGSEVQGSKSEATVVGKKSSTLLKTPLDQMRPLSQPLSKSETFLTQS